MERPSLELLWYINNPKTDVIPLFSHPLTGIKTSNTSNDSYVSNLFTCSNPMYRCPCVQDSISFYRCYTCSSCSILSFFSTVQDSSLLWDYSLLFNSTKKKKSWNMLGTVVHANIQGGMKQHRFLILRFIKSLQLQVFYNKLNCSILWLWSNTCRDPVTKLFVSFKQLNRFFFYPILKNYIARKCGVKRG